jgi:hypothetical protein
VLREYVTEGCRDGRSQPAELQLHVRLLEGAPAQPLLVLRREGHDSMIVDNSSEQGAELVFQAVTTGGGDDPVLHDVRLPRRGAGPGRLAYARAFSERSSGERRFQAYFAVPVLACRLAPLPLAAGESAPIGPQ